MDQIKFHHPGPVSVAATVTDDTGVTRAELWVDGALERTLASAPYTFGATLGRGAHQLRVYGYDAAGNHGRYTVAVTAE